MFGLKTYYRAVARHNFKWVKNTLKKLIKAEFYIASTPPKKTRR